MPNEIETKVQELAKVVEDKLGVSSQEVLDQWVEEKALVAQLRPEMDAEQQSKRAFLRLRGHWKKELRSPAIFYEGMIVKVASPMDIMRSMRQAALTIYEKNPHKAVTEGWTDAEGTPLDIRKTYKSGKVNADFGKPLPEHQYIQNIMGVAKSADMVKPVVFTMVLSNRLAGQLDMPLFTPVKFRANPARTQPTDGTLGLNEYSGLRFVPTEIEGFPGTEAVIEQFFETYMCPVEDLPTWHKQNEDDPRRFVIVEGDVDDVDPQANPTTGNCRIVLIDNSGSVEIVCWIPEHLKHLLIFDSGSRVIVGGRTAQTTFGEGADAEERTMINVETMYAIPGDMIPLEQEETPAEDVR